MLSRTKRYKTSLACATCRRRKLKCDGVRPVCGRCQERDHLRGNCTYIPGAETYNIWSRHGFQIADNVDLSVPAPATAPTPPPPVAAAAAPPARDATPTTPASAPSVVYGDVDVDAVGFASKVNAAIDARLGLPRESEGTRCPIPMTDGPLFAHNLYRRPGVHETASSHIDNVLPPRKHADALIRLYRERLEPLEPLLDPDSFDRAYQQLFSGQELGGDETVFVATLNAILALGTQLQESTPSEQRNEASRAFFQRAWSLLRPDQLIWGSGSVATVQCLLLLARFLQCTRNLQLTWMTVGVAVRMAQGLGLNMFKDNCPDPNTSYEDKRTGRQIWQCCVMMDRILSWTLGRTTMASLSSISFSIDTTRPGILAQESLTDAIAAQMSDIHEITNFIMLSQVLARSSFVERLGLPPLNRNADIKGFMQVEQSLNKVEASGSALLTANNLHETDEYVGKQWFFFRIRLAHARILLFRPTLVQCCLGMVAPTGAVQDLESRVLLDCARICVENAQLVIDLVGDDLQRPTSPPKGGGHLPWWYRLFYLWIATLHLIAARLRPEIFEAVVLDHWNKAVALLGAHAHLSPFVPQCIATFKDMWQKVADIHSSKQPSDQFAPEDFHDLFQQVGFDVNDVMLNGAMDDMGWLGNLEWDANAPVSGT